MNKLNFTKLILILLFFVASSAQASVVYTYTGNNFDTFQAGSATTPSHDTTMNVTVNLEFTNALMPNMIYHGGLNFVESFSMSDGINIVDSANFTSGQLHYKTDSLGNIFNWFIFAYSGANTAYIETINFRSMTSLVWDFGKQGSFAYEERASVRDNPGSWTVATIPLPSAFWLFGSGLLMLIGAAKKKAAMLL